jgi:hypothetical protein
MRRPTFLPALLLLVLGIAAACGDTGNDAASTTTAAERTTTTASAATTTMTSPATTTVAGGGSKRFVFALDDGSLNIDGDATSCTTPTQLPGNVQVTFKGETAQVTITATGGKGKVDVVGATQFDGTVTSVEVGANDQLKVSGTGTLAGSGSPVGFAVTGSCA